MKELRCNEENLVKNCCNKQVYNKQPYMFIVEA